MGQRTFDMYTSMLIAPVKSKFTARGPINPPHPLPTLTTSYAFCHLPVRETPFPRERQR